MNQIVPEKKDVTFGAGALRLMTNGDHHRRWLSCAIHYTECVRSAKVDISEVLHSVGIEANCPPH